MKEKILNVLYPRRCPACREIIIPRGNIICPGCEESFKYVVEPRCMKCSKSIESEELEYCYDCMRRKHSYQRGYSVFEYDKVMKKSMSDFKFNGWVDNADFYIDKVIDKLEEKITEFSPEVLVPVPIHSSKRRQRGYNQAEILAKKIGQRLGIVVETGLLIRNRKTVPQKLLDDTERLRNLKSAFSINERLMAAGHITKIMLVDDIYTTGSTIEACTQVLMHNGVKEVEFVSVCIGKGF